MFNLGIIGGGAMGSALIKGIINHGLLPSEKIYVVEIDPPRREHLKVNFKLNIIEDLPTLAIGCDTIILAVKPNMITLVLKELEPNLTQEHLLISIAAGITLTTMEMSVTKGKFVRVMPNTPAKIGKGVSAYSTGPNFSEPDHQKVQAILNCVGKVIKVSEHLMDAVTAISGSGPAYVFAFVEAMIDAGVLIGLTRQNATVLVTETVLGAVELMKETGEEPVKLKNEVTSPAGTTAAALFELEQGAWSGVLMKAIVAASEKAKELGKTHR